MKKFAALTAALGLAALISTSALAAGTDASNVPPAEPGGPGYGYGMMGGGPGGGYGMMGGGAGYGYHHGWANMTPEQQAEFQKAHAEFMTETLAVRQKIAAKRAEYATLMAQPTADNAKIKAVSDELVDLYAQLAKKRNEFAAKYPNAFRFGRGFGHGFHGGMMGGGFGGGFGGGCGR